MRQIFTTSWQVSSKRLYLFGFLVLIPIAFLIFVLIPVKTIPGNSLDFQLGIFTVRDYIMLGILSTLVSLFLTMQIFIFRNALSAKDTVTSLGISGAGGYVAVVGSVFATAACSSCLFAVLGFLGVSTVFTLVSYQWYMVGGAIVILLISIYFLSKKVNGVCESCQIDKRKI